MFPQQTSQSNSAPFVPYVFSEEELRRLLVYRAAVAAGFYTEEVSTEEM